MKNRLTTSFVLVILTVALGSCSVKNAVPNFEYPVYSPSKKWPELAPTEELENATDVDVEATIEEVERLKRLAS